MNEEQFYNFANLLALFIGLENLEENRIQSRQNDVQEANQKQAAFLLEEINKRFDAQDERINRILQIIEKPPDL